VENRSTVVLVLGTSMQLFAIGGEWRHLEW